MSADNLQAVREALAEVFNESNSNATGTGSLKPSFDHKTLSEAFSEPHLNAANTAQSFSRFDHAALTGLFRDPRSETPSSTSSNQALVEMLSERSPLSSNIQSPRPGVDHQAFAEILSEPSRMSTDTNPSQPSFDHQALAEMLTESRAADPVDPPPSSFSFDPNFLSSSSPSLDQGANEEPEANTSPPASAEAAQPPIAKSLLAKLHDIFSTKAEPSHLVVEKDRSPQPLSIQPNNPRAIATEFSTQPGWASTHPFGSAPTDLPSLSLEQEPSPRISRQSVDGSPAVKDFRISSAIDPVGAGPTSSSNEEPYPISTDTNLSSVTFERCPSAPAAAYRLEKVDHKGEAASVAAPSEAGAGSAGQKQAISLLIEPVSPNSNNIEPVLPVFGKVQSGLVLSGPADIENLKLTEGSDTEKVLARLAELISSMPTRSLGSQAVSSQATLSGQPNALAPAEDIVSPAARADVEHARPQLPRSLVVELAPPVLTDTGSPLHVQQEPSPAKFSGRSKDATSVVTPGAPSFPTNLESAEPQLRRVLAELTPTISADPTPPLTIAKQEPFPRPDFTDVNGSHQAAKALSPPESTAVQWFETEGLLSASPVSSNAESHSFNFENETSPRSFPGELDGTARAIAPVATATPPVHAAMEQPTSLPLTDLPALISTDTSASDPTCERNALPSSSLHRSEGVEPPVNSVPAVPNEAENAVPRHVSPLLTALHVLNTKPSPPFPEKTPSASAPASQPDNAETSGEPITHQTDAESASAKPPTTLRPDMSSAASTEIQLSAPVFDNDRWRPLVSDQPTKGPTVQSAAVASPADTESMVVTRAQQAKSLLDKLDLNTAIRLRWTMRDIRGKRTKFSPVSDDDLTALMNLGLVEVRDGLPRLTGLGVLALD